MKAVRTENRGEQTRTAQTNMATDAKQEKEVNESKVPPNQEQEDGADEGGAEDGCVFVIIKAMRGRGEAVQKEVWDPMDVSPFGFDFFGASTMYLGRECQACGPPEKEAACAKYLREYMAKKF